MHKCWKKVLGLCLMIFAMTTITSCTYDYFEDERNFRLYVPQIERGEIDNFYVAIHDASGRHIVSRELSAPFDKDEATKKGILIFKLPYGEGYYVSCFANYEPNTTTPAQTYSSSSIQKSKGPGEPNVYTSLDTDTRAYLSTAMVYPIGHPDAAVARVVNIDENQRIKGKVVINFHDLPAFVSRIDTYYKGLGTKYTYGGLFDRFSEDDRILKSINVSDYRVGSIVSFASLYSTSAGLSFGVMAPLEPATRTSALLTPSPLELELHLYDAAGTRVGVIPFTDADFQYLKTTDPTKVPTDTNGNPVTSLVLQPQQTITFNFKGFTIISIDLMGWGDITGGDTTPM